MPAQTVNRFCSSGLQTIAMASERIMVGNATTIVAGGRSTCLRRVEMPNFSPNLRLMEINPAAYMGMGLTAEQVAREFDVSREGPGRVRPPQPYPGEGRRRGRCIRRGDRTPRRGVRLGGRERRTTAHGDELRTRRRPARHLRPEASQAQARLPGGRHRHGGQLFAEERRARPRSW